MGFGVCRVTFLCSHLSHLKSCFIPRSLPISECHPSGWILLWWKSFLISGGRRSRSGPCFRPTWLMLGLWTQTHQTVLAWSLSHCRRRGRNWKHQFPHAWHWSCLPWRWLAFQHGTRKHLPCMLTHRIKKTFALYVNTQSISVEIAVCFPGFIWELFIFCSSFHFNYSFNF